MAPYAYAVADESPAVLVASRLVVFFDGLVDVHHFGTRPHRFGGRPLGPDCDLVRLLLGLIRLAHDCSPGDVGHVAVEVGSEVDMEEVPLPDPVVPWDVVGLEDVPTGPEGHEGDLVCAIPYGQVHHVPGDLPLGVAWPRHLEGHGDRLRRRHVRLAEQPQLVLGLYGSQPVEDGLAVDELGGRQQLPEAVEAHAGDVQQLEADPSLLQPLLLQDAGDEPHWLEGLPLSALVDPYVLDPSRLPGCHLLIGVNPECRLLV